MIEVIYIDMDDKGNAIVPKACKILEVKPVIHEEKQKLRLIIDTNVSNRDNLEAPSQASGDVLLQEIQRKMEPGLLQSRESL